MSKISGIPFRALLIPLQRDESLMLIREIEGPILGSNSSEHQVPHERVTRSRDDGLMNHR